VVVPFVPYEDVAGKILKLDHITDPNLRPLDDLLRDHFYQCVLNKMKGEGEPRWDYYKALGWYVGPVEVGRLGRKTRSRTFGF